jgi:FlaA1/EpsC-like NDP-sugar epimerase
MIPLVRNRYFLAADLLLVPAAAVASFVLRLEPPLAHQYGKTISLFVAVALAVKPVIFYAFGLYRHYWRYASVPELVAVALATLAGTLLATIVTLFLGLAGLKIEPIPWAIPALDWLVSLLLVGGSRFAVRIVGDSQRPGAAASLARGEMPGRERHVVVMGAGDAGAMIVREMLANPGLGYVPVGFLDDDTGKTGAVIHGVPVVGTREAIATLAGDGHVDEVIIAMPTAPGRAIRGVVACCQDAGLTCRTMPGIYELISGRVSVRQVREVRIEDLLRREPLRIDSDDARRSLAGAVVLVTGAGGSIGTELCRQIASYAPGELLLLGHGENSIHDILLDLEQRFPNLSVSPIICDVREYRSLLNALRGRGPQVVFHAAAHKHVPLMELNAAEAVMNNVFGTRTLLRAAEELEVDRFVLVSTDKAVNPMSVMGATKRVTEVLVELAAQTTGRAYVVVRFGNVLGSRGSVVPLFQRQIAAQGPVTVTDPDMRRYFMTIPEAAQLIIQAGVLGRGGEVFVLDMGEQIRIIDLAKDLIRLSGFEPDRDIEIVFCGTRPGEKLSEEMFMAGEDPRRTQHEKILVAHGNDLPDTTDMERQLSDLYEAALSGETRVINDKLREIVPEYRRGLQVRAQRGQTQERK